MRKTDAKSLRRMRYRRPNDPKFIITFRSKKRHGNNRLVCLTTCCDIGLTPLAIFLTERGADDIRVSAASDASDALDIKKLGKLPKTCWMMLDGSLGLALVALIFAHVCPSFRKTQISPPKLYQCSLINIDLTLCLL